MAGRPNSARIGSPKRRLGLTITPLSLAGNPHVVHPRFGRVAAAIEYLYDHAHEQPSLEEIAAHVHISPAHLQRQFQALAGISPKKMLQHLSLAHAKAVLARQDSVQQAALAAGLSGGGRLHDLFVTIEGMTPGEYKTGGAGLEIRHQFAATP